MTTVALCASFDRKAMVFGSPMVFVNIEIAKRMAVSLMANRGDGSDLEKYPQDFDLFYMGEYDTETGRITVLDSPRFLFTFGDLIERRPGGPEAHTGAGKEN